MGESDFIQEVVSNWLISRPYMKFLFNLNNTSSTCSLDEFYDKAINFLGSYQKSVVKHGEYINAQIIEICSRNGDVYLSKPQKLLIRKLNFMQISEQEIQLFLNTKKIENITNLTSDFESLYNFAQINEEIIPKLTINESIITTIIEAYFTSEVEKQEKGLMLTHDYLKSKMISLNKAINETQANSDENTDPEALLQINFEKLLSTPDMPCYNDANAILDEFDYISKNSTLKSIDALLQKLKPQLNQEYDIKTYYKMLVTYLFEIIYIKKYQIYDLSTPDYFIPKFAQNKACELGLPPSLIDFSKPTMTVTELVETNEHLSKACNILLGITFEYSPFGILTLVDNCLEEIKLYMTDKLVASGINPGFVPFDDTFLLFLAVLSVAKILTIQVHTSIACDFLNHKMLSNNLAYAQMMLKSAQEYQARQGALKSN